MGSFVTIQYQYRKGGLIEADNNQITISVAYMEQAFINAPLGEEKMQRFNTPVSIHVHSIRKRLTDADGVSAKATIDGLVHAGLLQDDSTKFVKEVSYSQEKGSEEETIITVTEVDND